MQNLEQIRAAQAIEPAKRMSRQVVSKVPSLIMTNGLLAAAAFAQAGDGRKEMQEVFAAVAEHLARQGILASGAKDGAALIKDLSQKSSQELQRATAESMAFLAYLKRFSKKSDSYED
jgi:CRISPR/Cas system CMR-associated protein Cmr5 small subunit